MAEEQFVEGFKILTDGLIEKLSGAFPISPVPKRYPAQRSVDEADCDAAFGGKRWDEVSDEVVGRLGYECLLYFDLPKAKYYLPTFLRYLLRDWEDRIARPVFFLSVESAVVHATPKSELLRSLNQEQRRCVAEFLVLLSTWYSRTRESQEDVAQAMAAARTWAVPPFDTTSAEDEMSDRLRRERADLRGEIEEAFAGVVLGEGVSWRESAAMDLYGSESERAALHRLDGAGSWQELVDDPTWGAESGVGGWPFLDPLGARYYLPPAMILCLWEFSNRQLEAFLSMGRWTEGMELPPRLSALSFRQLRCVARFVRFMTEWEAEFYAEESLFPGSWHNVLEGFWSTVEGWS